MRLFVGLDIAEPIREAIAAYLDNLRLRFPDTGARWTRPEGWHVTLKFIGETQVVEEIRSLLGNVQAKPFSIHFRDVGFFTPKAPRIFYAAMLAPDDLTRLAAEVDAAVSKAGIERESASYSPHLTLARIGSGRPKPTAGDRRQPLLKELAARIGEHPERSRHDFGTMTAKEFHLYESRLSSAGAHYTKLESYSLKG